MKINQYGNSIIPVPSKAEDRRSGNVLRGATGERVSISNEARQIEQAREKLAAQDDIREDKIQEARLALADGSLDDDAALEQALDRLIPDLIG